MTAFVGNTNLLELSDLTDEITGEFIDDADVVATVTTEEGEDVEGQTWPVTLGYVAESDGLYRGILDPEVEFIAGDCYIAEITATDTSGNVGYWEFHFTPLERG